MTEVLTEVQKIDETFCFLLLIISFSHGPSCRFHLPIESVWACRAVDPAVNHVRDLMWKYRRDCTLYWTRLKKTVTQEYPLHLHTFFNFAHTLTTKPASFSRAPQIHVICSCCFSWSCSCFLWRLSCLLSKLWSQSYAEFFFFFYIQFSQCSTF